MAKSSFLSEQSIASKLSTPSRGADQKRGESDRVSDEEAAKWAGLLVASLKAPEPPPSPGLGLAPSLNEQATGTGSSENSRPSTAAAQTGSAMTQSQIADTSGVKESVPSRLILNVDSETLGRVQLVVDRDEGGVRVVVGSDPGAQARLSKGKHALGEALSAAGVRVNSLKIVSSNEVGTVLAQDLLNKKSRTEPGKKSDTKERGKNEKTKRHNLNLVG